jgi:hypothetical protein
MDETGHQTAFGLFAIAEPIAVGTAFITTLTNLMGLGWSGVGFSFLELRNYGDTH